ncbi:MAG: LptF/LptG family permease [Candidatus Omnitrophica bacterium]|nr:LptF/LptG family permease [Candidatus Omnitrophota bacterium]MBU0880852.1 LptF/LptG family permease [Candidatus Omnitrophota bacterium]MBU1037592.1 LptF/LptG family permease [Candidatus Omnitrophota bacterium]
MRILRDYVLREFFHSFFLTLVVFTFVFLVGNIITLANYIINKGVEALSVFKLFIFLIPWLLSFTLPIAVLTASILSFGRLSADGELTAMRASGISLFRISMPILMVGVGLSFFAFFLNDQVSPNASFASRRVIKEIGIRSPAAALEEGTFIRGFENYIIFIHEINGNKLKNIRIYQPQENRSTRTIVAEMGEISSIPEKNLIELKLYNGTSEEPSPTDPDSFYKLNFKTYFMSLDLSKVFKGDKIQKKTREMTINELNAEIKKCISQNIDPTPLRVEIYKKINISVATFIFALIGIPLGVKASRSEKSIGFVLGSVLFGIYWAAFSGMLVVAATSRMDPALAAAIPNIVFFVIGISLFVWIARK